MNGSSKMSYRNLLSSDRKEFVHKIYNEIFNDASSITDDTYNNNDSSNISKGEFRKATFLSLVTENNVLLENEKEYCKKGYIYAFELDSVIYKSGVNRQDIQRNIVNNVSLYIYKNFLTPG